MPRIRDIERQQYLSQPSPRHEMSNFGPIGLIVLMGIMPFMLLGLLVAGLSGGVPCALMNRRKAVSVCVLVQMLSVIGASNYKLYRTSAF